MGACRIAATCGRFFHGGLPSFHFFQSFGTSACSPPSKRAWLAYVGSTLALLSYPIPHLNHLSNLLGFDARFSNLFGCPRLSLTGAALESADQYCSVGTSCGLS